MSFLLFHLYDFSLFNSFMQVQNSSLKRLIRKAVRSYNFLNANYRYNSYEKFRLKLWSVFHKYKPYELRPEFIFILQNILHRRLLHYRNQSYLSIISHQMGDYHCPLVIWLYPFKFSFLVTLLKLHDSMKSFDGSRICTFYRTSLNQMICNDKPKDK